MFVKTLVSLLPVVARVANAVPFNQLEERADYCAVGEGGAPTSIVKVITSEEVHYPVLIDTYCPENTILTGDGGATLKVDNAPTHIRTIVTGCSTATNTDVTTIYPASNGGVVNIYQTTNLNFFPVTISTYIESNTILQGPGGINIIINNAPTFILTTATGTETVTATVTSTVTETTTASSVPTSFLLSPVAAGAAARRFRRQSTEPDYVAPDGGVVANCSDAAVYTITNGVLSTAAGTFSTNTGVDSEVFAPSQVIGDISTSFSISDRLAWSNAAFSGGAARFCSTGDTIVALFTSNATAVGCTPQDLIVIPATACNDGVISSSTSSFASSSTSTSSSSSSATDSTSSSSSSTATDSSSSTSSSSSSSATDSTTSSSSTTSTTSTSSTTSVEPTTTVTCDPNAGQVADQAGTSCICQDGLFTGEAANGDLSCETVLLDCSAEVNPANQVVDDQTNTCGCDAAFFSGTDADGNTLCETPITCPPNVGQVAGPDNTCVCEPDLFTGDDGAGGIDCQQVLADCSAEVNPANQVVDPDTNTCVCDENSTPGVDGNNAPTCTLINTTVSCDANIGQIEDPNNANTCICSPELFTTTNPADNSLLCLVKATICLLPNQVLDITGTACVCADTYFIVSLNLGELLCAAI